MSGALRSGDERAPRPLVQDLRCRDFKNAVWKLRRHSTVAGDDKCLRKLLPSFKVTHDRVAILLDELANSDVLGEGLSSPDFERWKVGTIGPIDHRDLRGHLGLHGTGRGRFLFLYVATRLLEPEVVIETGCFTGRDSSVLLQALNRNARGHLYTIDLPAEEGRFSQIGRGSGLAEGLEPGFLVPQTLRSRWSLIAGDVKHELPPLLREVSDIGLFFHDSHHTYSHMMWEYASIWPQLAESGIIVSDDIAWNTAFWDFAAGVGRPVVIHRSSPNVGALSRGGEG